MDITTAVDNYRAASDHLEQRRTELHTAIRAMRAAGATQADIVRATGYTRETIRRLTKQD